MDQARDSLNVVIGLALVGASLTGVASLIATLFAVSSGEFAAMGLCIVAAAMSFGLLSNAVLRQ
jgi:hypothetical protein